MRTQSLTVLLSVIASLAGAPVLQAQNLDVPPAPGSAAAATGMPARGQSMAEIERRFGPPAERFAAVGQPPITRWVYPGFIVYFEYQHVVHAVAVR
jgi:hypothetical protein